MKVAIFGKDKESVEELVQSAGFTFDEKSPDIVITYGGDGTLVRSEIAYPGIPKVPLRNSGICKKCSAFPNETVLEKIQNGDYATEQLFKLSASAKGKTLTGMNDIIVHNKDPRHGIRYTLSVNGKKIQHEIVGDGIIVATPFGSTGYFRSITDSFFEVGIGIAFNNSTEQSDHMVVGDESIIEMSITRGPAIIYADNHEETIDLALGESVTIKKSPTTATLLVPR